MASQTIERRARRVRVSRFWRRAWRRLLPGRACRFAARLDATRSHELSTAELWSAWRLADLDCALELNAWSFAARGQRSRAFRRYRSALAREARIADLLAERCA